MDFGKLAIEAFNKLTPNLIDIYNNASPQTLGHWQDKQLGLATASGVGGAIIPGAHLLALSADLAFLMNRMSVCSFGIGAIRGYDEGHGNILEEEDFAIVLGYWSGDAEVKQAITSKGATDIAIKVGGKMGSKLISKHIAVGAGLVVGKKLGGKLGAKLGMKFGAKLGAKAGVGIIPILGPIVSGGINAYFINQISESANDFYRFKCDVISKLH